MILQAATLCIVISSFYLAVFAQPTTMNVESRSDQTESFILQIEISNHTFSTVKKIPSGWTTLSLTNQSNEHHLMMAHKLPEGISPVDATQALENWKNNREPAEWWSEEGGRYGGQGLLAPGETGFVTIFLDPGVYSLVCGFTSEDGTPHFDKGAPSYLRVTRASNGAPEPTADYKIFFENKGITTDKPVVAGRHIFKELFDSWHDVQLARLKEDVNIKDLKDWLPEWKSPTPTPFIGGLEPLEPGRTAYFAVAITPGRYAWVCSKHPQDQVIRSFTVD